MGPETEQIESEPSCPDPPRQETEATLTQTLGTSPVMRAVEQLVLRVYKHIFPILILGETGTGKELVARMIHSLGPRRLRRFVPVDCAALAPTLMESELFGHTRGAFTGASQLKHGLFEIANGGTLFLDEIGDLPLEAQVKLLRVMQEKEIRRIGATNYVPVNIRVVAATNRDLEAAVKNEQFRRDLYFRLNVVEIKLPPLRERKTDIPLLVSKFLQKYAGGESRSVSDGGLRHLLSYDWPGNVRELENAIERAVTLSSASILHSNDFSIDLSLKDVSAVPLAGDKEILPLKELERRAILRAVKTLGGNKVAAAQMLGMGKTTLYRKLCEYARRGAIG